MTRTYTTETGTRRISKIGLGEAEFMFQGAELVSESTGIFPRITIRTVDGQIVVLSSVSAKEIAAIKRSLGL